MLKRVLLVLFVSFSAPAFGQGPPPEMTPDGIAQQDQEQAALALEKEVADPNKIGNISQGSLVENFKKGGIIMYFILACSIIGVYVTIERSFSLQRSRILPRKFINNVLSIISSAPPRASGQGQPYSPYPSYPPSPPPGQGGYQSFSPAPAPQPSSESAPPYQAPLTPPPAPQPGVEDQAGNDTGLGPQASPEPPLTSPSPVPEQDSSPAPAPGEEKEFQKDMDNLLNILNKGLDCATPEAGSEEPPAETQDTDSTDPDQGSEPDGSESTPMNMSYPAGASYNSPYPVYNFAAEGMPAAGGYGGGYADKDVVDQIVDYCEGKNIPLARVLKGGLLVYNEGILSIKSAITNANLHEGAIMEKGVGVLGVLANVAPLLGLLGTVTGMIKAFEMISIGGTGRPEIVAIGISEALMTTAAGLLVGIPLLLLFHWLQGKVENMMIDLQEFSVDVVEKIVREGK